MRLSTPATHCAQRGFTLIEVMMALAIVAIALSAVSRTMGLSVSNQSRLETKVAATWLAQNELLRVQLMPRSRAEARQEHSFMGRTWQSELTTEPTLLPGVVKAQMSVSELSSRSTARPDAKLDAKPDARPDARLVTVVGE